MSATPDMSDEQTNRRMATTAGNGVARALAFVLDRLEDMALRALEQAAAAEVDSDRLRVAEKRLTALRSFAAPLPRLAARLVAGSTYFAVRWTPEAVRSAREILSDTSEFLGSDRDAQER